MKDKTRNPHLNLIRMTKRELEFNYKDKTYHWALLESQLNKEDMKEKKKIILIKCGQVWKNKNSNQKVVVTAVSHKCDKVFVCGIVDEVDPEFTTDYLIKAYSLDNNYWGMDYITKHLIPSQLKDGGIEFND